MAEIKKGQQLLDRVRRQSYQDTSDRFSQRYSNACFDLDANTISSFRAYKERGKANDYVGVSTFVEKSESEVPCYTNYFDLKNGVILDYSNFKDADQSLDQSSKALPNSEIFWHQYQSATEYKGLSLSDSGITKIVGYNITEDKTLEVIGRYVKENEAQIFMKGSNEYFALLGTPSSSGKAYLLEQHFGNQEIKAIEVRRETRPRDADILIYHIGDKERTVASGS